MPASDLHDPEDRDATGVKVKYLYCPDCGLYSGGGVCRVCERGLGDFVPPVPARTSAYIDRMNADPQPFVAIVCSRGQRCEVVTLRGLGVG